LGLPGDGEFKREQISRAREINAILTRPIPY
jgi:hypothetical protein